MSAGCHAIRAPYSTSSRSIHGHGSSDVRGLYLNAEFYRSKGISRQESLGAFQLSKERLEIRMEGRMEKAENAVIVLPSSMLSIPNGVLIDSQSINGYQSSRSLVEETLVDIPEIRERDETVARGDNGRRIRDASSLCDTRPSFESATIQLRRKRVHALR